MIIIGVKIYSLDFESLSFTERIQGDDQLLPMFGSTEKSFNYE